MDYKLSQLPPASQTVVLFINAVPLIDSQIAPALEQLKYDIVFLKSLQNKYMQQISQEMKVMLEVSRAQRIEFKSERNDLIYARRKYQKLFFKYHKLRFTRFQEHFGIIADIMNFLQSCSNNKIPISFRKDQFLKKYSMDDTPEMKKYSWKIISIFHWARNHNVKKSNPITAQELVTVLLHEAKKVDETLNYAQMNDFDEKFYQFAKQTGLIGKFTQIVKEMPKYENKPKKQILTPVLTQFEVPTFDEQILKQYKEPPKEEKPKPNLSVSISEETEKTNFEDIAPPPVLLNEKESVQTPAILNQEQDDFEIPPVILNQPKQQKEEIDDFAPIPVILKPPEENDKEKDEETEKDEPQEEGLILFKPVDDFAPQDDDKPPQSTNIDDVDHKIPVINISPQIQAPVNQQNQQQEGDNDMVLVSSSYYDNHCSNIDFSALSIAPPLFFDDDEVVDETEESFSFTNFDNFVKFFFIALDSTEILDKRNLIVMRCAAIRVLFHQYFLENEGIFLGKIASVQFNAECERTSKMTPMELAVSESIFKDTPYETMAIRQILLHKRNIFFKEAINAFTEMQFYDNPLDISNVCYNILKNIEGGLRVLFGPTKCLELAFDDFFAFFLSCYALNPISSPIVFLRFMNTFEELKLSSSLEYARTFLKATINHIIEKKSPLK